jgi:hypothetical protein
MPKVQTRFFLPSHSDALGKLREEICSERASRATLERFQRDLKSAKEKAEAVEAELVLQERNLLDAKDGSAECLAADIAQGKAWEEWTRTEAAIKNLRSTIAAASAEHSEAFARLRAARDDLRSVREGARKK